MDYKTYLSLVAEAKNGEYTPETLLAEWGYPADCTISAENLPKAFEIIFGVAESDIKAIAKAAGNSVKALSEKFKISYFTTQKWAGNQRSAPSYVLEMIGYIIISELDDEAE